MSTDIQAEEMLEDGEQHDDVGSQRAGPHREKQLPAVGNSSFRVFTVSLGVLYLLILAGLITRFAIEKQQLSIFNQQLQTRLNNLNNSYSQSQSELKQLQDLITDASVNTSQQQDEINKLKNKTKECPEGWKRFGCSCYFKSTEKKSWSQSRSNCQEKGSDLVMINSKEEQEFVSGLSKNEESWIGLRTTENKPSSTGYRWEWVDESLPTETFWATAELENPTSWFAAVCCDQRGKWTRSGYSKNHDTTERNWICEK